VHSLTGSITKIWSGHTLKAGGEFRKLFFNFVNLSRPAGIWDFGPAWTQREISTTNPTQGYSLASFLLGLGDSGIFTIDPYASQASQYLAGYVQDDWKVTNKLTLNLGLRYDADFPRTERYDKLAVFHVNEPSPLAGKVPAGACARCGDLRESPETPWKVAALA
jgi:outer membrane receptor protein involved in Fe transport